MVSSAPLCACLNDTIESLASLLAALEAEHTALSTNNAEQLELATRDKQLRLAAHQETQALLQQALGEENPSGQLPGQADSAVDGGPNQALFERLRDLTNRCQQSNQRNGMLIAEMQQRTRDALGILRNSHASPLYTGDGLSSAASDTRSLGKA